MLSVSRRKEASVEDYDRQKEADAEGFKPQSKPLRGRRFYLDLDRYRDLSTLERRLKFFGAVCEILFINNCIILQ